jgi:hypothetical protein
LWKEGRKEEDSLDKLGARALAEDADCLVDFLGAPHNVLLRGVLGRSEELYGER